MGRKSKSTKCVLHLTVFCWDGVFYRFSKKCLLNLLHPAYFLFSNIKHILFYIIMKHWNVQNLVSWTQMLSKNLYELDSSGNYRLLLHHYSFSISILIHLFTTCLCICRWSYLSVNVLYWAKFKNKVYFILW